MKRSTFNTLFYIKRNEPKKDGNVVIMVRITIDVGIKLLDHVIMAEENYCSFADEGLL